MYLVIFHISRSHLEQRLTVKYDVSTSSDVIIKYFSVNLYFKNFKKIVLYSSRTLANHQREIFVPGSLATKSIYGNP